MTKKTTKEESTAVAKIDQELAMEISKAGGSTGRQAQFPMMRLEHTTDFNGDPNPLRGHFTFALPDVLGEWKSTDMGASIDIQILRQRYFLSLRKGDKSYNSKEFDNATENVQLWESIGQGTDRKGTLFAEGTPFELGKKFLVTDSQGKTRTELVLKIVLYVRCGDQTMKWKLNTSGTFSYRSFSRNTNPFIVKVNVSTSEKKKGTNKYYVPVFKATEITKNLREVRDWQQELTDLDFSAPVADSEEINADEVVNG